MIPALLAFLCSTHTRSAAYSEGNQAYWSGSSESFCFYLEGTRARDEWMQGFAGI